MTKRYIFTRSGPCVNVAQLDTMVTQQKTPVLFDMRRKREMDNEAGFPLMWTRMMLKYEEVNPRTVTEGEK